MREGPASRESLLWRRPAALLLAIALVGSAAVAVAVGREPGADVSSGDGITLRLDGSGRLRGVRVGARELPRTDAPGGFSVRLAGRGDNLLPNAGFEREGDGDAIPDDWTLEPGIGRPRLDRGVSHGGRTSLRLANARRGTSAAVVTEVPVLAGTHYVLSAWMRTRDVAPRVPPTAASAPRVTVTQLRAGGRPGATSHAFGYTDTSGWARRSVGFRTGPDVRSVRVAVLIAEGEGTVWFDDLHLGELLERSATPVRGDLVNAAGGSALRATAAGGDLAIDAAFVPRGDHIAVFGRVVPANDRERGFQLTYTLPVDARGWRWGDDARRSRPIGEGEHATLSVPPKQSAAEPYTGISQPQRTSRYPFGGVWDERSAIALGVPLSHPRMFRIGHGRDGLSVTFDLGVSPRAIRLGGAATFAFVIFGGDPDWGFRSFAEGYYRIHPELFRRRTEPAREGAWFFAPPLDSLPGSAWRDFGLGLNTLALGKAPPQTFSTWGTGYLDWSNRRGIYTSAYTHQWTFFEPLPGGELPAYQELLERTRRLARGEESHTEDPRRLAEEAAAALRSVQRDENGRPHYETYREFASLYQNVGARLEGVDWPEAVLEHQVERAIRLARERGATLDGVHLDSTSGARRWGAVNDHDPAHWAASEMPLTFSYNTGEVAQVGVLQMHEQLRRVAELAHRRGMIVSANFNGGIDRAAGWIGADVIDYFGIEQGLPDKAGGIDHVDPLALLKRTLAYQRPVTSLDTSIADGTLGPEEIAARIEQSLFYGIFPGAWVRAENEAAQPTPTWSTPEKRAIFARYTPVLRALAAAGWEPLTYARSSNPDVWVERYGSGGEGDLHLALRNETDTPQPYTLAVELAPNGWRDVDVLTAREITSPRVTALQVNREAGIGTVEGMMEPRSTVVLRVAPR